MHVSCATLYRRLYNNDCCKDDEFLDAHTYVLLQCFQDFKS